jgi:hypothetical protein
MRKQVLLIIISVILITVSGCTAVIPTVTNIVTTTVTVTPVFEPKLSSQEAIALAKKHSVNSPDNVQEKAIGLGLQVALMTPTQAFTDWKAEYSGNGKWDVSVNSGSYLYHWTVFESNLSVVYIGRN